MTIQEQLRRMSADAPLTDNDLRRVVIAADRIDALEATMRRVDRCVGDGCHACHADMRTLIGEQS